VANPSKRKHWLDWQRGLAVLFMIEVHILDAWIVPGGRAGHEWVYDQLLFLGGLAAPGFLFMAGLSQALADEAHARKGLDPTARRRAAISRGLWLLGVSYLFRLFSYVTGNVVGSPSWGFPYVLGVDVLAAGGFGMTMAVKLGAWHPRRPGLATWGGLALLLVSMAWRGAFATPYWHDVVKVDVLNVLALGMMLSAFLAVGRPRAVGVALTAGVALLVVLAAPWVTDALRWRDQAGFLSTLAADPVAKLLDVPYAYVSGVPPRAQFMLFNWVAFLLAGAAVAPLATGESRPFTFLALALAVHLFGRFAAPWIFQPVPGSTAWRADAPAWFMTRLALHLALTGLLQLLPGLVEPALRWLTLLGRQSLTGYVFSVLLTYGGPAVALGLTKSLAFPALGWSMVAMIAVTLAACWAWEAWLGWERRRLAVASAA
jgi:surface polysaccharide O-acyltransferase-like enzyme